MEAMNEPASPTALVPHLIVADAAAAIAFYVRGLGAVVDYRLDEPGGKVAHAELLVNGARFMLASEYPEIGCIGPTARGGATCSFALQVENTDAASARAIDAGATLERPIKDEFYGDRVAWIVDPFGHRWSLVQRLEVLTSAEIVKRFNALMGAS